ASAGPSPSRPWRYRRSASTQWPTSSPPCLKWPTTTAANMPGTCGSYSAAPRLKASPTASLASRRRPVCQSSTCPRSRPSMSACISRYEPQLVRQLIELTEAGLPLVDDPWAWLAERLQLSVTATLNLLQQLQDDGAIRRIAAVPNHYRLGYQHNGMTVWD